MIGFDGQPLHPRRRALHIVDHAMHGHGSGVEDGERGSRVAVGRQPDAPGIDDGRAAHGSHELIMGMANEQEPGGARMSNRVKPHLIGSRRRHVTEERIRR